MQVRAALLRVGKLFADANRINHFIRRAAAVIASFALLGTSFAANNVVELTYDAAGNITNIVRQPGPGFGITSFDPVSGAVGSAVTIYGLGFSGTPANNIVKFNGTTATVSAADSGSIATTVPAGATTGRITVTVGGVTATSPSDFVVTIPGAPTIASFTPSSGVAGTGITVSGTNFDTAAGATTVKLNGNSATANITTATSLGLSVPGATSSGRITVTTAGGVGMSATDFIVPPTGINASDIAVTSRISADGPAANIAIGVANAHGLILFDGTIDTYYTIQLGQLAVTPSSALVAYKVVKPDNTVLVTGSVAYSSDVNRPTIHLPKLTVTGTYSLLLSPGVATFNGDIKLVTDPVLTVDGSATAFVLDTASQSARIVFNATGGQRIGVGILGFTLTPTTASSSGFRAYNPDGTQLGAGDLASCNTANGFNPQGNCDGELLTSVAGMHTIIGRPYPGSAASFSLQLSSEVAGTLTADSGSDVTLARVGQDGRFTFTATTGDSRALTLSGIAPQPQAQAFAATILKPDGSTFLTTSATPPAGSFLEMGALATAGTYTVVLDPSLGAYGALRMTLKQGTLLTTSDSPNAFAPATTSEATRYRFSGTAGQNLVIGVSGLANVGGGSSSSSLNVYGPDRAAVGTSASCTPGVGNGSCKVTLTNLPASGIYSFAILPPSGVKITGNASIASDITGTLVAGTPQSVNATRDGQNARYTFSGTAGDSLAVKLYGVTSNPSGQTLNVKVFQPNGSLFGSGSASSVASSALTLAPLPATGTYTVLVEPFYGVTWSGTLALDAGTVVTVDGATQSLASGAGEPLRFKFAGTSGQRMEWGVGGLTYGSPSGSSTTMYIYQPSGSLLTNQSCSTSGTGSCELSSTSLPTTGTYSVVFLPPVASSITGGTFAISTPLAGTFVVSDPAQTIAITRPGQTVRYTFSGTAAQLLRLTWTSVTVSGGASVAVSVLKPDGSTLTSSSFVNGASSGVDIASLPSTGSYTVVMDPTLAATMSASMSVVTR